MIGRRLSVLEIGAFGHVPDRDRARARVLVVTWLPPGTAGLTLGRWILVRRTHRHDAALLAHELVHVRQWRERGAVRFLYRYLAEYCTNRCRGMGHWPAYRAIGFEVEARALVRDATVG